MIEKRRKNSVGLDSSLRFKYRFCLFFVFFFSATIVVGHKQCNYALFMVPQTPHLSYFFIKNESHYTIHIFKNYFVTVFSVFSFQFQ